jgi:hypothetical protein
VTSILERFPGAAVDQFVNTHRDALESYAAALIDLNPSVLISISRKGPRLIDLINSVGDLPYIDVSTRVSEKALPFMAREELEHGDLVVTDDTLIYGSTFRWVTRPLETWGPAPKGLVLAKSTGALEELYSSVDAPLRLSPDEINAFVNSEIRAFAGLTSPYDVDHPILHFGVDDPERFLVEFRMRNPAAFETTKDWQRTAHLRTVTVPATSTRLGHSLRGHQLGPDKVRLFLNVETGAASLVGIFSLAVRSNELQDQDFFDRSPLSANALWYELIESTRASRYEQEDGLRALAYAAHYLAGAEQLLRFVATEHMPRVREPRFHSADAALIFGQRHGTSLGSLLNSRLDARPRYPKGRPQSETRSLLDPNAELQAFEASANGRALCETASVFVGSAPDSSGALQLDKLLEAERLVFDEMTRGEAEAFDGTARLDVGIAFSALPHLLMRVGGSVDSTTFDRWCDEAIDCGNLVPRYARSHSDRDLWVRVARFGESNGDATMVQAWAHQAISDAADAFEATLLLDRRNQTQRERALAGLPAFETEKLFALMARVMPGPLRNKLHTRVWRDFGYLGARAQLEIEGSRGFLVPWLEAEAVLVRDANLTRFHRPGQEDISRGKFLRPAGQMSHQLANAKSSLDAELVVDTAMLVEILIKVDSAFDDSESRGQGLLALTTCGTEAEYLEAVTREMQYAFPNIRKSTSILKDASAGNGLDLASSTALSKYLHTSYLLLSQVATKRMAFENRVQISEKLNVLFLEPEITLTLRRFWQRRCAQLISRGPREHERHEQYLWLSSSMTRTVVTLIRDCLRIQGALDDSWPADRGPAFPTMVAELNDVIRESIEFDLLTPVPELLPETADPGDRETLQRLGVALAICQDSLDWVLAHHAFPRPVAELTPVEEGWSLLLWDVNSSSESSSSVTAIDQVNEYVEVELRRFDEDFFRFEPSPDDGHGLLVPSIVDALRLAQLIAETLASSNLSARMSIVTPADSQALRRIERTRRVTGRPFNIGARVRDVFSELERQYRAIQKPRPPKKPDGSYLVLTEYTRKRMLQGGADIPSVFRHRESIGEYRLRGLEDTVVDVNIYEYGHPRRALRIGTLDPSQLSLFESDIADPLG